MKGSEYLQPGIDDLIFHKDSHVDGNELVLKLTRQFLDAFRTVTAGHNYQNDFDTFVLKALVHHYKTVYNEADNRWDSDKASGIACVVCLLKDTLFIPQTPITNF